MSDEKFSGLISELVCTRLSHDLIGNIGAVSNAVELMDDDPGCVADVKPILEISSFVLSARLKFFRLAFGLDNTALKTTEEIQEIAQNYIKTIGSHTAPIELSFNIKTPELYKVILLCIMALGDVFIRGGQLAIVEETSGLSVKALSASPLSSSKLKALQDVLDGNIPEENPAQSAPLIYLKKILSRHPVQMVLQTGQNQAEFKIG